MYNTRKVILATLILTSGILANIYRYIGKTDGVIATRGGNNDLTVFLDNGSNNSRKITNVSSNDWSNMDDGFTNLSLSSEVTMVRESWNRSRRINQKYIDGKYRQNVAPNEKQRRSDLQKLSAEIWTKLWNRQNPENCDEAQLVVIHTRRCGFGCNTHCILIHLLLAFYSNRTLVLKSKGWGYDAKGWDHYLMPLGKCDYNGMIESLPIETDENSNARIVRRDNRTRFLRYDWKVPRRILATLRKIHSDPYAWWIGQFINYLVRFQPWFMKVLTERSERIRFTNSTLGLHVRWGDKITKHIIKHPVAEYMNLASTWFKRPENQGTNKTVYVASEQSEAWQNLEDNYDDFRFIGSGYVNRNKELDYQKAAHYGQRKNELDAILLDIYFLTKCPYVVCTFSSNICRLLYEVMATHESEPTNTIQSLDDKFYWLMTLPKCRVIEDHDAGGNKGSIDLKIGDIFLPKRESAKIRTDSYVLGKNNRTGLRGRVPKYKLEVIVEPLNFHI